MNPLDFLPEGAAASSERRSALGAAVRVGAIYLILCVFWIVFSDRAVEMMVADPGARARIQTLKGLAFVTATALLVAVLAYRELRVVEERDVAYRNLIEQNLVGIYLIRKGRFLFVNRKLAKILGYAPEELRESVPVSAVIAPEDWETVRENLRRREEGEVESLHYKLTAVRRDGEEIRGEVHGRRVEWKGQPAVMGVLIDITRQERLEERARSSQKLEVLGQLTGAVAHDFNNVLTTIAAPLELCQERLGEGHPAHEEIREAREGVQRATTLTRQLLSFSRRRVHRPRPLNLNQLVLRSSSMLSRLMGPGVELEFDPSDSVLPVEIDPSHFDQALLNLVVNAAEAVEERGTVRIRTAAGSGRRAVLEVSDDGPGMDEETRKRLFEPFFTTKNKGTGLGLATVHGIVTQAGGSITVDSEPGRGSTFRVILHRTEKPVEVLEEELGKLTEESKAVEDSRRGGILVVEDEEALQRVLVRALERHGHQVLSAADGAAALSLFRSRGEEVDLVVTDIGLPDMDGIELVRRLEEIRPDVAALYMSGHSSEQVLDRLAEERDRPFLEKPFSVRSLIAEVGRALAGEEEAAGDRAG